MSRDRAYAHLGAKQEMLQAKKLFPSVIVVSLVVALLISNNLISINFSICDVYGNGVVDTADVVRASYYEIPILSKVQDAYSSAAGIPLDFTRTFSQNSQTTPHLGPFGRGWTHSYNLFLQELTDGNVAFYGQDDFVRWFQPKGNGAYLSTIGDYGVLSRDSDGLFKLREKSGSLYKFNSNLALSSVQDPNGNLISCTYDQNNRLSELRHSDGNSYRLEYNGFNHISKLIDNVGRATKYDYSSDGS